MKINREELLGVLKVASVGAAMPPRMVVLEQSDCFVFKGKELVCFNDEILTRSVNPLDFDTIVTAGDFLKILGKLPDKIVEISLKEGELIVKGKRRSAGITVQSDLALPYTEVPKPGKFHRVRDGVTGMLKQAARTCGKDLSNPLTTVVHAGPEVVEACDNFRLFRAGMKTGFPRGTLLPAPALHALEALPLYRVSVWKGWAHFKTSKKKGSPGATISVRCIPEEDYKDMDLLSVLKMPKTAEVVKLPPNLADMVERSEVMSEGSDPLVRISIKDKILKIKMQKDSGWYTEQKRIRYTGTPLSFLVNPKFLVEVLHRTTTVKIGGDKMKLEVDGIQFIVVLEKAE